MKEDEVTVTAGPNLIRGTLTIPDKASAIVLFAHGSGSGRFSVRNRQVAKKLQEKGMATLLMDLLTEEEEVIDEQTREYRFDIDLLAERLVHATNWLKKNPECKQLSVGYFGASTGAAAALIAAASLGDEVQAVVSRGGRPDLADAVLNQVKSPTLLIVGGNDYGVIELNEQAYKGLASVKHMEIVEGATHLFEETGALERVADLASNWFTKYL